MATYKTPTYDDNGLVKCEICEGYFARVACHVLKAHQTHASDYKRQFGFSPSNGLCSIQSKEKTGKTSRKRYTQGKMASFVENSKKSQYQKGESGRFKINTAKV